MLRLRAQRDPHDFPDAKTAPFARQLIAARRAADALEVPLAITTASFRAATVVAVDGVGLRWPPAPALPVVCVEPVPSVAASGGMPALIRRATTKPIAVAAPIAPIAPTSPTAVPAIPAEID